MTSWDTDACVNRSIHYDTRLDGWYHVTATEPYHVTNAGIEQKPE